MWHSENESVSQYVPSKVCRDGELGCGRKRCDPCWQTSTLGPHRNDCIAGFSQCSKFLCIWLSFWKTLHQGTESQAWRITSLHPLFKAVLTTLLLHDSNGWLLNPKGGPDILHKHLAYTLILGTFRCGFISVLATWYLLVAWLNSVNQAMFYPIHCLHGGVITCAIKSTHTCANLIHLL